MTQTELKKEIRSIIKDCYQTGVQDAYDNNSHFGEPNLWTSQILALTQKAVEDSWEEWTGYLEMWFEQHDRKNKKFQTKDLIDFISEVRKGK